MGGGVWVENCGSLQLLNRKKGPGPPYELSQPCMLNHPVYAKGQRVVLQLEGRYECCCPCLHPMGNKSDTGSQEDIIHPTVLTCQIRSNVNVNMRQYHKTVHVVMPPHRKGGIESNREATLLLFVLTNYIPT